MSDAASLTGRIKNAATTTAAPGDELHAPSEGDGRVIGRDEDTAMERELKMVEVANNTGGGGE